MNKNSLYIGALTSFILDTKPFHSKLTEIQEIYQFSDSMTVKIDEGLFSQLTTKAAWPYQYFSGGIAQISPGVGIPMPMHQLFSPLVRGYTVNDDPLNTRGSFKAFRDENTDLPLVPFAFDPKCLQGAGLSDAFVQRNGTIAFNEPLLEGHDVFLSRGAYTFQIKQTVSAQPLVVGRFVDVYEVTDGPFPFSVVLPFSTADSLTIVAPENNATQVTLDTISITGPGRVTVFGLSAALNVQPLFCTRPNDGVMAEAIAGAQITDPGLSTDLARGVFTDYGNPDGNVRESGALHYNNLQHEVLAVTNIVAEQVLETYEELVLKAITPVTLAIYGSSSGLIGVLNVGDSWNSTARAFDTSFVATPVMATNIVAGKNYRILTVGDTDFSSIGAASNTVGEDFTATSTGVGTGTVFELLTIDETFVLTPSAKITVHYQAALETWSIISTNPMAYSRPVLTSTRYGYIRSQSAVRNYVTIIDQSIPTCTITITCTSSSQFTLSSSAEPLYTGSGTVGVLFNDGRLAFTVIAGSAYAFSAGDKFFVEILNEPPVAEDLDIYYGFDMDPYDADTMVYNSISSAFANYQQQIGFGYDSRFPAYDISTLGLTLAADVVNGRQWRLRALPNLAMPLNLQNAQGGFPVNQVSVIATNDPLNPNAVVQFDMQNDTTSEGQQSGNDPDTIADALLYYATSFEVEYLNGSTWTSIGTTAVGVPFTSASHGISFTIAQGMKPYISGMVTSSWYPAASGPFSSEIVTGGDTIAFTIKNSVPVQTEAAGITGRRTPRLVMYGENFHDTTPAKWTLTFINGTTYRLQGIHTSGVLNGSAIFPGLGISVDTSAVGNSYKNNEHRLHYTIVKGNSGLAPADSIAFETYEREPTFLVHGSVSGWQPTAAIDEWYWNGKIGFKIPSTTVALFDNATSEAVTGESPWTTTAGIITLNRIRRDAPSSVYTATSHTNGHWTLYRDGGVVADGTTRLVDQYLDITMPTGVAGTSFRFHAIGHEYPLAEGNDLAIIRTSPGRMPTADDFVLLERTRIDTLQISIKAKDPAHELVLNELAPVVTDLRFVDHNANSGAPLVGTSPETGVVTGWLGVLETRLDRGSSVAEFRDAATAVVVRAAATGETIGKVETLDTLLNTPVVFRWDPAFHTKYLPLNAEATVVSLGSGMDERVNVSMKDTLFLLLSGGVLAENALFTDTFTTTIAEENRFFIQSSYSDAFGTVIADTGFTGFLPGYDNLPFDFDLETGDVNTEGAASGYFDAGVPLTDYFLQAQSLALLPSRTPAQQALLLDLIGVLSPYGEFTVDNLIITTMTEFIARVGSNPPAVPLYNNAINWTPTLHGFGIPDVGLGIEIQQSPANAVSTSITEGLSMLSLDTGYPLGVGGFGIGGFDALQSDMVFVFSHILPPAPGVGVIYEDYSTPLSINSPGAQNVQVSFGTAIVVVPTFYIWRLGAAPLLVTVVERVNSRTFRFSVPIGSEMKIIAV